MVEPRPNARVRDALEAEEPLGTLLDDQLDESRIKRMWQHIDHAPTRDTGWWRWAVAAAVLVITSFGGTKLFEERASTQLGLLSGGAPSVLSAERAPISPRFDDGSQVSLEQGSRLEVLRNDARSFVTALRRGDATFDVRPGGKRHWIIEAGELTVEVVGTRFRVERLVERTTVSVDHGVVVVRGERVPEGSVRLTAGQRFELGGSEPSTGTSQSPSPPSLDLTAPSPAAVTAVAAPSALRSEPIASSSPAPVVDEVARSLHAADEARRLADYAGAARHFDAAWRAAAAGDTRRGLAALSLTRLLIGAEPAKAAGILQSSMSDMPRALLEDAMARLVEAHARAGNHPAAAQAAAEYLQRFPDGQRAIEVERWSKP